MGNLFSLNSFQAFSFHHIIILSIFTLIIVGVAFLGVRCRDNNRVLKGITYGLIVFTVIQEICDYLNRYINGTVSLEIDLPFHICHYVLFMSIIALYNQNKYIFNFCYFNAFSGALIANLTPDLNGITGDLGVFFFFLHHFLIIINVVWMMSAFNMTPDFKGVISTIVILNVIAIPVALVNMLIDKLGLGYANYMYLREPPPVDNPLLIGEGGRYILGMEVIASVVFVLLLAPFWIFRYFSKNKSI